MCERLVWNAKADELESAGMLNKVKQGCSEGMLRSGIKKDNKMETIIVDGAQGEGGGQIFRSALTLAVCLGKEVRIENIRAGRNKPGILRQHLACLKAAQEISDAHVEGDEIGSQCVRFAPRTVRAGKYHFSVGTAGSTTLIMQTIMMPLLMAKDVSDVVFEGGTHNSMAPTFDFFEQCFLPRASDIGGRIEVAIERYGFYPAGGGLWRARIHPVGEFKRLQLCKVAKKRALKAVAISSKIPKHVGERELAQVKKICGWDDAQLQQLLIDSVGPGNVISLRHITDAYVAMFDAFGEKNVSAEKVAKKAISAFKRYERSQVPVCEYLADQLIIPLALGGGGAFMTQKPTGHLLTNIQIVKQIAGVDIAVNQVREDAWLVEVSR